MRTTSVVLALIALGCGKSKEDHSTGSAAPALAPAPVKTEASPPPKEAYKGKNRLVNLLVDPAGKTSAFEVWTRRGFKWGPVKLADSVPFGKASPWFGVPEHMSPVVLPTGSKPDDKEVSPMAYGAADEVVTGLLMSSNGVPTVVSMYDVSKAMPQAPKPPAAGTGAVILFGYPLRDFEKAMADQFGGSSFNVGDGTGACRPPRDPKFAANALGGTSPYELDLPPGKAKVTLHKWPAPKESACASPAVFEVEVDVVADHAQWVFLYTPDLGKTIASTALPIGE